MTIGIKAGSEGVVEYVIPKLFVELPHTAWGRDLYRPVGFSRYRQDIEDNPVAKVLLNLMGKDNFYADDLDALSSIGIVIEVVLPNKSRIPWADMSPGFPKGHPRTGGDL